MKKKLFTILLFLSAFYVYSAPRLQLYKYMEVTENLRLRTPKHDGRKVITVLNAGTKVKIIDINEEETIDGITSNWVKIEVQRNSTDKDGNEIKYGVVGWCFGGYLKESKPVIYEPDYANGDGTIISKTENDTRCIEIRKHIQKVEIGDMASGEKRNLYSDINKTKLLYTLQDYDEVEISEFWTVTEKKENLNYCWLKVKVEGFSGFILFYNSYYNPHTNIISDFGNPYQNNRWEIIETIHSAYKRWTVRKLTESLSVFSDSSEIELRDIPGEYYSSIIGYVPTSYKDGNSQINVETEAVTEELDVIEEIKQGHLSAHEAPWVRITYNGKTGWILGSYLSAERGGPKYYIPEHVIDWGMGWHP